MAHSLDWSFHMARQSDGLSVELYHGPFIYGAKLAKVTPESITNAICSFKAVTFESGEHWPVSERDALRTALQCQL